MTDFKPGNPLATAIVHIVDGESHFYRYNTDGLSNAASAAAYAEQAENKANRQVQVRTIFEAQIGNLEPYQINMPTATELEWNGSQGGPHGQFSVFGVRDLAGSEIHFNALNLPGYSTLQQAADDYAADPICEVRTPHDIEVRSVAPNGAWSPYEWFSIVPTEL